MYPNSSYFGLKGLPIGTFGATYLLFGYMDPYTNLIEPYSNP